MVSGPFRTSNERMLDYITRLVGDIHNCSPELTDISSSCNFLQTDSEEDRALKALTIHSLKAIGQLAEVGARIEEGDDTVDDDVLATIFWEFLLKQLQVRGKVIAALLQEERDMNDVDFTTTMSDTRHALITLFDYIYDFVP